MIRYRKISRLLQPLFFVLCISAFAPLPCRSETCETVVSVLNQRLSPKIDERELAGVLRTLNDSGNATLPDKFVTKKEARDFGWKPGKDLWSVPGLKGKSIGGDSFGNREGRLPAGKWREADLDYKGSHRGPKRLIFSGDGRRYVTVDHYKSFTEVSSCR